MPTWHPLAPAPSYWQDLCAHKSPSPPLVPTPNPINLHGLVQLGGQSLTLWGKAIFCPCRVWSMVPLVATAFSVDTVVTARHSVTSPSPSCPPPAYPLTAHPPQFAPGARSAGIVIWNRRVFSYYTLLSSFFFPSKNPSDSNCL